MENKKYSFTSPSRLKAGIIYVLMIFIGITVFSIIFSMIAANSKGIDSNLVASSFFDSNLVTDEIKECQLIGQSYGNLLAYLIAFAGIVLWQRNDLIDDFQKIKEDKKLYAILIPCFSIGFGGLSILIDYLFGKISDKSQNQSVIELILKTEAAIPMIFATIILAPVVEELIYRKSIFAVTKDISLPMAYISSILLFSLPHMLSTSTSVGMWFLQLIPYMLCGGMLCLIYHLSNYNIYVSISAHMLNNLLAVIIVLRR